MKPSKQTNGFSSEKSLVDFSRRILNTYNVNAKRAIKLRAEVKAPGCIPDVILYHKQGSGLHYVISIEFKLQNWRRALTQAFVHRNFCNESYVVLDYTKSESARKNLMQFKKSNVGLATVDRERGIEIWLDSTPSVPFSMEYSALFSKELLSRKTPPTYMPFTRTTRGGSYFIDFIKEFVVVNEV